MNRQIEVAVYPVTGRQGIFEIPHHYCEECDLTISVTRRVVDELDDPRVTLVIRPWLLWFWKPLIRGGWHAPIVTVNGRIVSQGVVPSRDAILQALDAEQETLAERREARNGFMSTQ